MTRFWLPLALLLVAGCTFKPAGPSLSLAGGPRPTADAQPLELSLMRHPNAEPWTLASQRGRVVLLDVWATWCDPCRDALPLYQDLAKEFAAQGLVVYALNVDADERLVDPFLADAKVTLPVLRDPEARVAESTLGVKLMPTALLIDKKGQVRFVHEGFDEGLLSTWLSEIQLLLAEP